MELLKIKPALFISDEWVSTAQHVPVLTRATQQLLG